MGLFYLCREEDCREIGNRKFQLSPETSVVLYRTREGLFATEAYCPHAGGDMEMAQVDGSNVSCAWHGWKFELPTGTCLNQENVCIRTYQVVVRNGAVYLEI